MEFRSGLSINCRAEIQNFRSIVRRYGAVLCGHLKIAVFSKKKQTLVPPHKKESGETLGETFFSQILMYMENTNVSFGKLQSLDLQE